MGSGKDHSRSYFSGLRLGTQWAQWLKCRAIQRSEGWGAGVQLTLRRRHLFSLMAPRQPRKPVTMTMVPMAMTRLAADSDGKLGEKVAKLPWDTESQMPTPSSPQPQSWREREAC